MNLPVLIPAYNPDEMLLEVARSLIQHGVQDILIVNDGSNPECAHIFKRLEAMKQCRVIHHAVNLGKGRAIKTGLNYFYLTFEDAPGIITADADGQHQTKDILKVAETFFDNPDSLIIGARRFDKRTPLRSLIGNIITKYIFRFLIGKKISDTQSGLRCIPRNAVLRFIKLEGEKYDYEMNMLISTKTHAMDVVEEKISTIYIGNNKSSHFNPVIDSMTIYFLLLRFAFSSFFASIIDFIIFAIIYGLSRNILAGIVFARLVSGNINFFVNRNLVFYSKENVTVTIVKYYTLFVVLGGLAFISVRTMSDFGMNVLLAKIVSETLLFIASFSIQRDFIFTGQKKE